MQFLYPLFLFALFTVAVPIIIHLFNFRTYKTVYFSNVQFLKNVKQETKAQSQLKHLLVLLARILALAALVFAFAQPYIPASKVDTQVSKQDVVSIYIDNSFSMDAESKYGNLLEVAKNRAREIADSYRNQTRFLLITNDFDLKHQHLLNKEQLGDYLDVLDVSPSFRMMSNVFDRQKDFLYNSVNLGAEKIDINDIRQSSYVLSDFQRVSADIENLSYDSLVSVTLLPLATQTTNNLYIDSCWFELPGRKIDQPEDLYVKIVNLSQQDYQNIPLRLFIHDSLKAMGSFNIEAGSEKIVPLSYTVSQRGTLAGRIEITDYPVTYDNTFYFAYTISQSIEVLTINQTDSSNFIHALFGKDDYIRLTNFNVSNVRTSEFSNFNLIILNEIDDLSSGLEQALVNFVSEGGSLVLIPTLKGETKSYNPLLQSLQINTYQSFDTQKTFVENINLQSQLYRGVFRELDNNLDLPVIFTHYTLSNRTQVNQEILLSSQNQHPILVQSSFGNGKVFTLTTSLNDSHSNFGRHPLFVPTFYNMALYSQNTGRLYYVVGRDEVVQLAASAKNLNSADYDVFHVVSEAEGYDFIPRVYSDMTSGNLKLHMQQNIQKAGIYSVQLHNSDMGKVAFNYNRIESDMTHYTIDELEDMITEYNLANYTLLDASSAERLGANLEQINQGLPLWKWFILLTLLFLATEIALLRFMK